MRIIAAATLFAITAAAQVIVPGPVTPSLALRQYLELSTDQVTAIDRMYSELRRFQTDKARRAAQVRIEIQDETSKPTLDAMALGVRYVEIEAIQREMNAKTRDTAAEIQRQLSTAQRSKLQALLEILRTYPLACEAANLGLITPDVNRWFDPTFVTPLDPAIGGLIFGVPGSGACGLPVGLRTRSSTSERGQP